MQTDIMPPGEEIKNANRQTMRSLRLRGQSLDGARERLSTMRNIGSENSQPSPTQPVVKPLSAGGRGLPPPKKSRFWHGWSKRRRILVFGLSLLLLVGVGALAYTQLFQKGAEKTPQKVAVKDNPPPPPPATIASPLTGVQVAPELAARPVTAIMIENSTDARPQSGLQDAGVVFEAIAEGGITRFITLFQDTSPQYIGPVRSLRPYYIDFASPFDAGIAHVGGSPDALAQIRSGGKDLDQFFNAGTYWRVSSRRAPHNVYTSFERLDALNKSKGYTSSKYTSWPRKEDQKLPTPTAKIVDINISSPLYNAHFDYDPASNSYLRSEGGRPHTSTSSEADSAGQQIKPKVVIALAMSYSTSGKYSVYGTAGSGSMYIFQDGAVIPGIWHKPNRSTQFTFADANGQPIKLNAGQTWITLVGSPNQVSSQP